VERMSKSYRVLIFGVLSVVALLGFAYYGFRNIDFIGHKDPEIVKANLERWDKMLLKAEFRNGTDYCEINLLDSINIEINVGDSAGGTFITENYKLASDTIIILNGIKHVDKYINSSEMLIQNDRILYLKDSVGNFDSTQTMEVKFNKLKKVANNR
jgi:hypothetical protein